MSYSPMNKFIYWIILIFIGSLLSYCMFGFYVDYQEQQEWYGNYTFTPSIPNTSYFINISGDRTSTKQSYKELEFYVNHKSNKELDLPLLYDGNTLKIVDQNHNGFANFIINNSQRHIFEYNSNFRNNHNIGIKLNEGAPIRICIVAIQKKFLWLDRVVPAYEDYCSIYKPWDIIEFPKIEDISWNDTLRVVIQGSIQDTAYTIYTNN